MVVHFTDAEIDLVCAALDRWGLDAQVDQTVEECAELIVALQKHVKRTPQPGTFDAVTDEIADVEIHDFRFSSVSILLPIVCDRPSTWVFLKAARLLSIR